MKILHVIPGLTRESGGPSVVVQALTQYQAKAGHSVTVLTTDQGVRNGKQQICLADGVQVHEVRMRGSDRLAYAPGFAGIARPMIRAADLLHVHSIFTYPVHTALREAQAAGVPVVLRPCGQLHPSCLGRSRWRKRAYLAIWGRMVRRACSAWHYTSQVESSTSWPWDCSPRFVLPHGVEASEFAVDRMLAREAVWRWQPQLNGSPYVLFLGRIHPIKRLDILLEAFLAGAPRTFKLVVAGPDVSNLWESLATRFLREPGARERVVRVGMALGAEKVALLAGATLFALPSEHENFGLAALEALAAGTPVLLSPHVDLAQAALRAGLAYTAPLDTAAWRDRLATLLANPAALDGFASRARHWVNQEYSWSRISNRLQQQYERILGRNSGLAATPVAEFA